MTSSSPPRSFRCSVALVACLCGGVADAREDGASGSALGLGDAVRSTAVGPAALYFNPAALHHFTQYTIETGYQYLSQFAGHAFSVAAADSASNQWLAMGAAYTYYWGHELTTDVARKGHGLRVAVATGYRGDGFSVHAGASYRYINLQIGETGKSLVNTIDVGILATIKGMFRLGVTGHNLIPTYLAEAPRQLGFGASFLYENFLIAFDPVMDFDTHQKVTLQYNFGAEYAISGIIPLRLGYQLDKVTNNQYITGGIGYVSKWVAADFGFRQNLFNGADNIFSVNVRAFIP